MFIMTNIHSIFALLGTSRAVDAGCIFFTILDRWTATIGTLRALWAVSVEFRWDPGVELSSVEVS